MLTKKQKNILDYITQYIKENDYSPTIEEMAGHFGKSVSTIHQHIEVLKSKGFLSNQSRIIELENEKMVQIPLLGTIAAGQPIEAIEEKETVAVLESKLPKSGNFFGLRVIGKSMIDEGIDNNDIVIVKSQETANNGQKVVALINNEEVTLKKLYKEKNKIRLQPANAEMEPIYVNPKNLMIQGVVIEVIKDNNFEEVNIIEKPIKKYDKLPLNQIIKEDTLIGLKKIPNESCNIIIADPPYNIGKDFGNNQDKRELTEYINWSKKWINECIRIMKSDATMFIYGFSEILAHLSVEIPINKRWLIWHYTNKNVPSLNFWQRSHEAILCCWKNKPSFNRDDVREAYTEGFLNGAAGKIRNGTRGRFSRNGKETIYKAHEKGALPRDVIKIPALAGGAGMSERWFLCKTCKDVYSPNQLKKHLNHNILKHPTQKPLELSRRLIKSCAPKKEAVILVPFAGSGSECVATKELGYSYIGYEINPDYIKIANKILKETKHQTELF